MAIYYEGLVNLITETCNTAYTYGIEEYKLCGRVAVSEFLANRGCDYHKCHKQAECTKFVNMCQLSCAVKPKRQPYEVVIMLREEVREKRYDKLLCADRIRTALPCEMYYKS